MKTFRFFNGIMDFPDGFVPKEIKADRYERVGDSVIFIRNGPDYFAQLSVVPGWFVMEKEEDSASV